MKRFYKDVTVEPSGTGFTIALDGRGVKTPGMQALEMPTKALAGAVAAEWHAQGETIDAASMPVTRLANTTIDRVQPRQAEVADDICAFGGTDLLCYRADEPQELIERQDRIWNPYLSWMRESFGIMLKTTAGIMPVAQDEEVLTALRGEVNRMGTFEITAMHEFTNGFGSLVLAMAYMHGYAAFENVWKASLLDQLFQEEQWGEDYEITEKRKALREDLGAACLFLSHVRDKKSGQVG